MKFRRSANPQPIHRYEEVESKIYYALLEDNMDKFVEIEQEISDIIKNAMSRSKA